MFTKLLAVLLFAIHGAESGFRTTVPDGDNGRAWGPLQIHQEILVDVNRLGHRFKRADCYDLQRSKQIAGLYLSHYGRQYQRATGKQPTHEVLARIWNGGPDGYKRVCTERYWAKVSPYLR